jgi:ribonucleoside-diphosphate reductase alpha chain
MFKIDIARDNWNRKYRYGDESEIQTWERVARAMASVEKEPEKWFDIFLHAIVKFRDGYPVGLKCTPGGRITANIGTGFKGATLLNCFIAGPVSNATIKYNRKSSDGSVSFPVEFKTPDTPDDLVNIFLTVMEQAKTLASEGGYGINMDWIRPRGSLIKGTGIKHPGVVAYLKIWDAVAECIVKGDQDGYVDRIKNYLGEEKFESLKNTIKKETRKGAMMCSLSTAHPDCEEFVKAKQTAGVLTKFNTSVLMTDDFLFAVENDDFYEQKFNGKTYKKIKARDLYNLIMESCYNRAEPGVLFFGNMQSNNPISYLGLLNCTNPCVRKGTLVATKRGLIPVEEIKIGDDIQTTLGFGPVTEIKKYDSVQLYRVTFSDMSHLDVTSDHIFLSQMGHADARKKWDNDIRLKDVKEEAYVRKEPYKFGKYLHNRIDLTRDTGLLAGLFLGDGHIDANGNVCISSDNRTDNSFVFSLCERVGFSYWTEVKKEDNGIKIMIGGRKEHRASRILQTLGLNIELEAPDKTFPIWWMNTNMEFLSGVLDGLISSDGNINDSGHYPQIRIKSTSFKLHEMIRHLMLLVGADYKLYQSAKKGEKHKILGRMVERKHDIYEGSTDNDSITNLYSALGYISHPQKNEKIKYIIRMTSLNGVRWRTQIKSIEKIDKDTVYDIYESTSDDWNTCGIVNRGCGEIGGLATLTTVCLLGSLNLTQYVELDGESPYFDWNTYEKDIKIFARMLDNVCDLATAPLPSYTWAIKNVRQYGMGINGLGSTLMMLHIPYNSPAAVEFSKKVAQIKENLTWQVSAQLAMEKGTFHVYDKEKFENTAYFKSDRITEETKNILRKYGARNGKTTTCPPSGTASLICNNTSNGIEPVYQMEYERKIVCKQWPEGLTKDNIESVLAHHKKKDYEYWEGMYNGKKYYYEPKNRGLCDVSIVRDYGYQWLLDNFPKKDHSKYLISTKDLTVSDHMAIQEVMQFYCNQSISKTVNLPAKYPFKDFKDLYLTGWRKGLVGLTTYRENSMESVLSSMDEDKSIVKKDLKLPDVFINGPTSITKKEGMKFYIHFSYLPEDSEMRYPICMWIYTNSDEKGTSIVCNKASRELAKLALSVGIDNKIVAHAIDKCKTDYPHNRLGRMISLCLRHNIRREDILGALHGIEGDSVSTLLAAVRKFVSNTLKDGTPVKNRRCENEECKSDHLVYEMGCVRCLDCHALGCG